jgi:hypothetical protein
MSFLAFWWSYCVKYLYKKYGKETVLYFIEGAMAEHTLQSRVKLGDQFEAHAQEVLFHVKPGDTLHMHDFGGDKPFVDEVLRIRRINDVKLLPSSEEPETLAHG